MNKEITETEYLDWKLNWPDTCDDCGKLKRRKDEKVTYDE